MALITPGSLISEVRGSIGDVTYSRNRGGAYSKAKLVQTNPDTSEQQAIRAIQAAATAAWQGLTPPNQKRWNTFAQELRAIPRIGDQARLSGFNAFVRYYMYLNFYGGSGSPDTLPPIALAPIALFQVTSTTSELSVTVEGTNTDADTRVIVRASGPRSPGQTAITQSLLTVMANEQAPNGSLNIDITSVWEAKWGSLASAITDKIFIRVDIVKRDTAQRVISNRQAQTVGINSEYQAILDVAQLNGYTEPSSGQQILQNTLIEELKAAGIWQNLNVLYVFATDGDRDFAKINWKVPTANQATEVNTLTFTTDSGFFGNGSNSYLNTHWQPNSGGSLFTQNDASFFEWVINNVTGGDFPQGCRQGGVNNAISISPRDASNLVRYRINDATETSGGASTDASGFWHVLRTSSTAKALYKNGSSVHSASVTSLIRPVREVYLQAMNQNLVAGNFTNSGVAIFGAGASLSGMESDLYTIINTYLGAI